MGMSPQINSSHAFKTPSVFYLSFARVKMTFPHHKYLYTPHGTVLQAACGP